MRGSLKISTEVFLKRIVLHESSALLTFRRKKIKNKNAVFKLYLASTTWSLGYNGTHKKHQQYDKYKATEKKKKIKTPKAFYYQ